MTAISYHETVKDLQDLDWSQDGPFARPAWFALLERTASKPFYVLAKTDDGAAICLPLTRCGTHLQSLTNWYAFTWQHMQTQAPAGENLWHNLAANLARHTHRIALHKLPDISLDQYRIIFREYGWIVIESRKDINHVLPLKRRTYAQYIAQRPGRVRTTLSRKAKKVDVTLTTQFTDSDWAEYEAIYAASWKPEEGDPALLRRFAEMESAAGRYRFALARHNGAPVAAQFWTVDNRIAYIHKLAHRPQAEKLSPGTTLTAALMEHVIDIDNVTLVDFGTGDDAYKHDWMEEVRIRHHLICLRPEAPRNWPIMVKAAMRRLRSKLVSRCVSG